MKIIINYSYYMSRLNLCQEIGSDLERADITIGTTCCLKFSAVLDKKFQHASFLAVNAKILTRIFKANISYHLRQ